MNPMVLVWIVFGCVFGVGLLAMRLRTALPEHHLSDETKDTVKIAMGLLATISALVLGLMVASAKSSYDAQKNDVVAAAAKFVMLDRMLAHYGPETIARARCSGAPPKICWNGFGRGAHPNRFSSIPASPLAIRCMPPSSR